MALNDNQPEIHFHLGKIYLKLNALEDALIEFDKAFEYDNEYSDALTNKGMILERQGKYLEAREIYCKAHEICPDDIKVMESILIENYNLNDVEGCNHWINKLIQADKNNAVAKRFKKKLAKKVKNF